MAKNVASGAMGDRTTFSFETNDGLRLVADRHEAEHEGETAEGVVLLLHGGGQTRFAWGGTARALAVSGWTAIALDLRGHGESDWSPDGDYRLARFANDIGELIESMSITPAIVGASLGGLSTMLLLGEIAPDSAVAMVLVDIIPDMEPAGVDRIREFMADRMNDGFETLDEVADAVALYNPHRPRPTDLSGLKKNLRERDGRWFWHWDPVFMNASGVRGPSEISDVERLESAVESIELPKLLVRGRMSDVVSAERAEAFLRRHADFESPDVSAAGHMVAGDRNDVFTDSIVEFLRSRAVNQTDRAG